MFFALFVNQVTYFILDSGKRQTIFVNIPIISPYTENESEAEAEAKLQKAKRYPFVFHTVVH